MKIRLGNGLLPLNIVVILLIAAIIFFPSNVLRIILGLPFVLFFPGYALMAALFPRRGEISGMARVALSFGLSIALVPLIGLILNYTPWGVRLEPMLYSLVSFILVVSVIAWVRRRRLREWERFSIEFQLGLPSWGESVWDKVLSVVLVITILGALGMVGYAIARPKVGERFTEFYILGVEVKLPVPKVEARFTEFYVLGLQGKAIDYPHELGVGEEGKVIVGIINREQESVSYRVEINIDGIRNNEIGPVALEHDGKWEGEVGFVPRIAGENQKVEFFLYKNGETEPCLKALRLWIDVTQ